MVAISSPFGWRMHPTLHTWKFHNGIDLPVPVGTPVLASEAGHVVAVFVNEEKNGSGYILDHGNGWRTAYLHMSRLDVPRGAVVGRGQQLGLSGGKPGAWGAGRSSGPHVHFMIYYQGTPINPAPLLRW